MIGIITRWREGLMVLLLLASASGWLGKIMADRKAEALQARVALATSTLERERKAFAAAAALARAQDAANAARVERDQIGISQEVENAYQKELAELRRRHAALRLRADPAGADSGGRGGASMPALPHAAGEPDGAAGKAGLPADGSEPARSDALIASEQALRLRALQEWVRAQSQVERPK